MSWADERYRNNNGEQSQGAVLLDAVHAALIRYVVFPSPEAADAVALWVAATHAQVAWEHATRLIIKSPVRRCGKTRLLEVTQELCHQVLATTNISVAALVRSIGLTDPPTIVLDEADGVFATRRGERSEGAEDLRCILNAGHARGWPYIRWDAQAKRREDCPTFAMAVLAGIGDMPDTIEDRAIVVTLRRRAPGEQAAKFRRRHSIAPLKETKARLAEWVSGQVEMLKEAEPHLPVEDRAADVWEPLVAIADQAGGHWPKRARDACKKLTGTNTADEADATRLLTDIHSIFNGTEKLSSTTLLEKLNADETRPWGGWHRGIGLNPRDLARMLRPYGISPKKVRLSADESPLMGYEAAHFLDAWTRYTDVSTTSGTSGTSGTALASHVPDVPDVPDAPLKSGAQANPGELGPVDPETMF